jgi:Ca2+-binding RTX toxin-like protein
MSLDKYLGRLFHRTSTGHRTRRNRGISRSVPQCEILEARRVLTGNITAVYDAGSQVLTFTGDAQDNEVSIRADVVDVPVVYGVNGTTINGAASLDILSFTGGALTAIVVNSGGGADSITLETPANGIAFPGSLTINGEDGNDTVNVGAADGQPVDFGAFAVNGGAGDDTVSFRSDLIMPTATPAQLNGGGANDKYIFDCDHSLSEIRITETGGGIDTLDFSPTSSQTIFVDLDSLANAVNPNLELDITAGTVLENIIGGSMGDTLRGNGAANHLIGNGGNDTLLGRLGDNTLEGGAGDDQYQIGSRTTAETDTLVETSGSDFLALFTFTTDVTVNLGAAAGTQTVSGAFSLNLNGSQFEGISGGFGNDTLTGRTGLGTVFIGNDGNDTLTGSWGDDYFYGSAGNDTLAGWGGNDTYDLDTDGDLGTEAIFENGSGIDTLSFSKTASRQVSVNLASTLPQVVNAGLTLTLSSGNLIENVIGGAMRDTLIGNELPNRIDGAGQDDLLTGGGNSDTYLYDTKLSDLMFISVRRDAPQQTVSLTGISDSVGGNRPISVTATSSNTSLVPNPIVSYVSPNTTGSLVFAPVLNQTGSAIITVSTEDGGPDNNLLTVADNVTLSSSFTVDVTPVQPVLTAPGASTTLQRPTFTWSPVIGAASYRLYVSNLSTAVSPVIDVTIAGTTYTPLSDLGIGQFTVSIRAITAGGVKLPWSVPYNFRIDTPVSLVPMARNQSTYRPTVSWNALPGAHHYDFWLDNVTTGVSQLVRDTAYMGTSWTPGADLPMGVYRAWVRGVDAAGVNARWSATTEFVVAAPPVPTAPLNSTFEVRPQFTWNAVLASPGHIPTYSVYLQNMNTGATITPTGINGTSWTPAADLAAGLYRWWVQASLSATVRTLWSSPIDINIGGRPFMLPLTGTVPTFNWRPVTGAVSYNLWVNRTDTFVYGIVSPTGLGVTSYTPGTPLAPGQYRAWVQSVGPGAALSLWSVPLDFTITAARQSKDLGSLASANLQLPILTELAFPISHSELLPSVLMTETPDEQSNPVHRDEAVEDGSLINEIVHDRPSANVSPGLQKTRSVRPADMAMPEAVTRGLDSDRILPLVDDMMATFAEREFAIPQNGRRESANAQASRLG